MSFRRLGLLLLGIFVAVCIILTGTIRPIAAQSSPLLQVTGSLETGDAIFPQDNSLYDEYTFEATAGQAVIIRLESIDFDAYLLLSDTRNQLLSENDDASPLTRHSEIISQISQAGTYTVRANAYDATGRGHYSLSVIPINIASYEPLTQASQQRQAGEVALLQGDLQSALAPLQQALAIYRRFEHAIAIAGTLNSISRVHGTLGQYPDAFETAQQAIAIYQDLNNQEGISTVLNNTGALYYAQGDYSQALSAYEQALDSSQIQTDQASILGNIGVIYVAQGNYSQALAMTHQALAISQAMNDPAGQSTSLNNLGLAYTYLGQYDQALSYFQQSLAIDRERGDRYGEGTILSNIGAVYISLERYTEAITTLQHAQKLQEASGDRAGEGQTLNNLGATYDKLQQFDQALAYYQQARSIFQSVGNQSGEGRTISNLGLIYAQQGNLARAQSLYQEALVVTRRVGDRYAETIILEHLAELEQRQGQYAQAEVTLYQATQLLTQLRDGELSDADKVSLFDLQRKTYQRLQQVLVLQQKTDDALVIAEQGRARAFVELIAHNATAKLPSDLDIQAPSLNKIRQIAGQQQATLVEYSIINQLDTDPTLYAWVIQPSGEISFYLLPANLANNEPLGTFIAQTRGALGAGHRGRFSMGAQSRREQQYQQQYQQLIAPLRSQLPVDPMSRIIFVPQDDLFLVPFPALQAENGDYLITQHTLQTAPSIQVLDLTRRLRTNTRSHRGSTLVVGNPTMPQVWMSDRNQSVALPALPGAQQEAQSIAALLQTQPLIGGQATESLIKQQAPMAQIIHLATHGLLEYGNPKDSGVRDMPGALALTPSVDEDGLLTSAEILNLDLNAELVVMSACDTGLGDITGDGVLGLSRSLMTAGVPSVIASLWSIPDAPTAALMTTFYEQLQQGQDKAQALRQAMLATLQNYPNPRDWAAFTLMGEAS